MIEINKLFSKEMVRYRSVTTEFNAILKRKYLLEAKLFKKKYEKVQKHLNGNPNIDLILNPFRRPYQPSIFNDKMHDNKMEIPHNKELFDNVIKDAFTDKDEDKKENDTENDDDDDVDLTLLSDKQIIERIKQKFRKRVME
jgi:hypothetical protein